MKMWSGKKYSIVMAVLMICVMSMPAAAQLADTPWPMFHHTLNHTGLSTGYGPDTSFVNWTFSTGGRIYGSAAIGADGTIYIGTRNPGSKLYAIYPNGTEKWHWTASHFIDSTPAVASDGTIYVGSWDKSLYASYPNGTKKWKFSKWGCTHCGGFVRTSAAIAQDGTIYIGNNNEKLCAIYPNGTEKWNYCTAKAIQSSPAIDADGIVYVGSCDKKLYAIYPNGTPKWSYTTGDQIQSSPAIDADGTVYVGSKDGYVYAINPNGTLLWNYYTGKKMYYSSPAIAADGTVYIGNWDGNLYAFGPGTQPPGTPNMPPSLDPVGDRTINETETVTIDLNASDQDGDPLTYSCNRTDLFMDFDSSTGAGNWTTVYNDAGTYWVNFGVSDGNGGIDNETIRIDVLDANRPPVLDHIGDQTINETETVMIDFNASDQDGDSLTYSCNRTTELFTDFDPVTGTGNWTTDHGDSGTYWIDFGVSDGNGGIDNETIRITVSDADRQPVLEVIGGGGCRKIGEQFDILINITPMGVPIRGAQFDLHYNGSVIMVDDFELGGFLTPPVSIDHQIIDNSEAGVASFAASMADGTNPNGVTDPGTFVIVHCMAMGPGATSQLSLTDVVAYDNSTPVMKEVTVETCNDSVEVCSNARPIPVARSDFAYNNMGNKVVNRAYFNGTGSYDDESITTYSWWFGDGQNSADSAPEHVFNVRMYWDGGGASGHYVPANVTLVVTDDGMPLMDNMTYIDVTIWIGGDANGDGVVNIGDSVMVGYYWGSTCNTNAEGLRWYANPYADMADMNNDGNVNIGDTIPVGYCWGHTAW